MFGLSDKTIDALLVMAYNQPGKKTHKITRLAMYQALANTFAAFDGLDKTCLALSRSIEFARILGLVQTTIIEANYPEHNILDLNFPDNHFDFCISDQVLEHVEGNPFKAISETARILKPGGFMCHTTCFINKIHGAPKDFWRYTPDALSLLCKESGLHEELVGGWGNREATLLMKPPYRNKSIPDNPTNPLYILATRNEHDWPVVVWVVARKA